MRGRITFAILLCLAGLVFIGQGLGYLRGSSFMDDDVRWAVIGAGIVLVGAALLVDTRRRQS